MKVKIMPIRIFDEFGSGESFLIFDALDYAIGKGVKVSNHSYGIDGMFEPDTRIYTSLFDDSVLAGHIVVTAAGNEGENTDPFRGFPNSVPAVNIISVANVTRHNTLAVSSNFGATSVDLGAPGEEIKSTVPVSMGSCVPLANVRSLRNIF